MATDSIPGNAPACKVTAASEDALDINRIENASADLFSAAIMCDVTERSLSEVRAWLKMMGKDPANVPAIMEVDVMLFTIKDAIKDAKATIDKFVDDAFLARRKAQSAVLGGESA